MSCVCSADTCEFLCPLILEALLTLVEVIEEIPYDKVLGLNGAGHVEVYRRYRKQLCWGVDTQSSFACGYNKNNN